MFAIGRRARDLDRARLGRLGERLAARRLRRLGFKIIGRNIETPVGEADLVCRAPDRSTIVVVEVKTRVINPDRRTAADMPEHAVNPAKKRTLVSITHALARANNWRDRPLRIDVVAIEFVGDAKPTIRHHVNAVTLDDVRRARA